MRLRPYCHPFKQKSEIEKIVQVFGRCDSTCSSPFLVVKKQEGTQRMSVDYNASNDATINDNFPITAIDELLDELHGLPGFLSLT